MFSKIDKFLCKLTCKIIGHNWIEIDCRGKKMCRLCYIIKKDR